MTRQTTLLLVACALFSLGCSKSEAADSQAAAKPPAAAEQASPAAAKAGTTAPSDITCGGKGQPDCPLEAWMKANLSAYVRSKDFKRLAGSLEKLAAAEPSGYSDWSAIALKGAKGAKASDMAAVRKSCKDCHDAHRTEFKAKDRLKPLL